MKKAASRPLDLQQIFTWLMADGVIDKANAKAAYNQAQGLLKNAGIATHPLTAVAQCKLQSALAPHKPLTLDWLSEWVAAKAHMPFFRIDPLKIDFTRVA
ncbi:MAG: type II/IV secretion system protein, partial [Bacillota bacterium]